MADRFPRAALNPSAQPWVREVERRLLEAEKAVREQGARGKSANRTLVGLRGRDIADGVIYRRNGVVVPVGSEDFTIYSGATADQGGQFDESNQYIADGSFASLNVQPRLAAMRTYDPYYGLYGYARLSPKSFDVSWGNGQNVVVSHDGSLIDDTAQHWAITWEWEAPGSSYDGYGHPERTRLQGSLFDGAITVLGHQDWTPNPIDPSLFPSPQPVVIDSISLNGEETGGGGGPAVVPATTTAAGIVELATDAEAIAGTDTTRAVTPHALAAALDGAGSNLADAWRGDWVAP